mmetsp:Transcript_6781/g.11841  ORF Transcript_6781/g.11841 Transcript_6781/m.11841 type:complete len:250 (-) Transcript_6781:2465-3214(-)
MNIADLVHSADDDETDTVLAGQTSSTIANEDSERDPRVRLLSGSARLRLELAERHLRSRSDETTAGTSTTTTDTDLTRDTEHIANTIASLAALSEASTVLSSNSERRDNHGVPLVAASSTNADAVANTHHKHKQDSSDEEEPADESSSSDSSFRDDDRRSSRKPVKRRRTQNTSGDQTCTQCGTSDTPNWRRGPLGIRTLCNACGLQWSRQQKKKVLADRRAQQRSKKSTANATTQPPPPSPPPPDNES